MAPGRRAEQAPPARSKSLPSAAFRALPSLRLHLLARQLERDAEAEYLRIFGLRLVECRIIGMAGGDKPVTLKRICADLELDKAHGSRVVTGLVARGLLRRKVNAADGRAPALQPTAKGRRQRARIYEVAAARNAALMAALPARRRTAFLRDLDMLAGALRIASEQPSAADTTTEEAA